MFRNLFRQRTHTNFELRTLKLGILELLQQNYTVKQVELSAIFNSVVEIYPPDICVHGPGEDPFEAVMYTVGAASQISLLMEVAIFNAKQHLLYSAGYFTNQVQSLKRYYCKEKSINRSNLKRNTFTFFKVS